MKKTCLSLLLILTVLLCSTAALAGLAALSYTDTNSEPVTVGPAQHLINPTGALSLYLAGGLERKVGYVLLDGSGQTVAEGISAGLITAADQFTVLGQSYYGKVLTTPAGLEEGDYLLKARILDAQGNQVSSQDIALTVDVTPPSAGGIWWHSHYYNNYITGNELVSPYYVFNIFAKEVSDAVGIDRVRFESFNPGDGSVYHSVPAWHDAAAETAGVGTGQGASVALGTHLPEMDGLLGIRFTVYDKAGNKTVAQATAKYNGAHNPLPQLVGIYNPNVTTEFIPGSGLVGYEAYTPGMTVYTNPIKLLYRLARSNWVGDNPDYGLNIKGGSIGYTDAQYVYCQFEGPYSASGRLEPYASLNFGTPQWVYAQLLGFYLALSPTAPQTPKVVSSQWKLSDQGWISGKSSLYKNQPVTIQQFKIIVEPRSYNQIVEVYSTLPHQLVTIPAGQTEITIDIGYTTHPGMQREQGLIQVWSEDYTLSCSYNISGYITIFTDTLSPSITSYALDRGAKTFTFQVTEPQSEYFANSGYSGLVTGWLLAHNSATGAEVQINGTSTRLTGDNFQVVVNYASLPEGEWQFALWAQDIVQNTASQAADTVVLDQTSPQIGVYREAIPLADHGSVTSLGQVRITLSDNVDADPELTGVQLTGGPQGQSVTLAARFQDGAYVLEYPVMFPSLGQEYTLVVNARDASGNLAARTVPFTYAPPQITLSSTGQETLNLPALPANVVHADGSNALISGVITIGGSPVSGSYDLVLMTAATATTTLVVSGLTIAPGEQKTLAAYDFAATGGKVDLRIRGDEPGQADLMITSTAPNFPVLMAKLNIWRPELQLSPEPGWAVQPLIQTQTINLLQAGTPCRLSLDAQEAQASDPINDPVCLVEWTGLPGNYQVAAGSVAGVLPAAGAYTPGYQIYVFNNGQQYQVASGVGQALERLPIQDLVFTVETTPTAESFYRKVQNIAVKLQSSGSYRCPALAVTQAEAQEKGANQVVCLVRWTTVPEGLAASTDGLTGNLAQAGDHAAAWAVDLFSPYGTLENAVTGGTTLTAVNPPLPELSFEPSLYGELAGEDLYVMSELRGGEFAKVKFGTKLPNVNLTLELDGADEGHTTKQYVSANNTLFSRNLKTGELGLWENRPVIAKLYYTNLPDWTVEKQVMVVGVPSKRIKATLTAMNQTVDTTGVPVKLAVGVPGPHDVIIYNSLTDGDWQARFGYLDVKNKNEFHALTDYQPLTNGVLETTLTGFDLGFQKLQAEVRLAPPAGSEFYARNLTSNTAYSTVLKGTAPEGQIYSRTLTGPAPLSAVLSLQVESDTRRIMGAVEWQLSADAGATWQALAAQSPYQVTATVNAGTYLVRAKMTNQLSGAVGYADRTTTSEAVRLIAYQVPQLELTAPAAVIVGTPVTLKAQVMVDGQVAPAEDVVIEWYDRTGEKVFTGANLEVTPADTASLLYSVQARTTQAPAEDRPSWVRKSIYVRVVPPGPPTGLIAVPGYMEYNLVAARTYQATAKLNLAAGLDPAMYPIRGEWHLPDGSTVAGPELNYRPTAADAESRKALFEYVTWIEGFKEQTQAVFRRMVLVGTYAWPEFRVEVKAAPEVAPSLVTLTAAPESGYTGRLEKPAYTWQLPASAQLVRELDNGRALQVNFPEAGSFEVGVTVTDARGATAQAAGTVALGAAEPFRVEFAPLFSNSLHRESLDVTLRANVTGGHPQDRLTAYEFSSDSPDAQVTSFTGSGIFKGFKAGEYTLHLRAVSKLGQVVEADYPLSVIANQLPTCQVTTWEFGDYRWWKAVCSDSDGRLLGYRWYQDDQLLCSGQTIRVKKSEIRGTYRFEAFDDGQGFYRETLLGPAG